MAVPKRVLKSWAGDGFVHTFTHVDGNGNTYDLTGATVGFRVFDMEGGTAVLSVSDADAEIDVSNLATGIVVVDIAEDHEELSALVTGTYAYELDVKLNGGKQNTFAAGPFHVKLEGFGESSSTDSETQITVSENGESTDVAIDGAYLLPVSLYGNVAKNYRAVGDGTTDDRAALAAMDSATGHNVISRGTYKVDSDITFSSFVHMEPEAILKPASGVTITFAGGFGEGGNPTGVTPKQHFDVSLGGEIVFNPGVTKAMLPEWWGAVGNNTNAAGNTTAIQAAITAAEKANNDITYLQLGGNVTIDRYDVIFGTGAYLHRDLSVNNTSLIGQGKSNTALKHDAQGSTTADAILVGSEITDTTSYNNASTIYDVWIKDMAIVGDGDLTKSGGTANTTRYGVWANKAIYGCGLRNVTISQCQVGVKAQSCWTYAIQDSIIFNCPRSYEQYGGHGYAQGVRFEGIGASTAAHSDHGVVTGYDVHASTSTAALEFSACAFEGFGKSGFRGEDLQNVHFTTCLFERNNKADASHPYCDLTDNVGTITFRGYTFTSCLWTTSTDTATTSIALNVKTAEAVTLIGGEMRDGSGADFANSITSESGCDAVLSVGFKDSTTNGRSLHAATRYHDLNATPEFEDRIRIIDRTPSTGKQFLFQSTSGQLRASNETDGITLISFDTTGNLYVYKTLRLKDVLQIEDSGGTSRTVLLLDPSTDDVVLKANEGNDIALQDSAGNEMARATDLGSTFQFEVPGAARIVDQGVRLLDAAGTDYRIRTSGDQFIIQELDGATNPIIASRSPTTGWSFRNERVHSLNQVELDILTSAPSAFPTGTILYADGATYDPGEGEGFYVRENGVWEKMVRQAAADANDSISNASGTDAAIIDALRDEVHDLKDKLRNAGIIAT